MVLSSGLAATAHAVGAPRPTVVALWASTSRGTVIPAQGGPVVLHVRVRRAAICTFLRQTVPFSSLYAFKTVPCASGQASVTILQAGNRYRAPVKITFAVKAGSPGTQSAERTVTLAQAAAVRHTAPPEPQPTTPTPTATPTATLSVSSSTVPAAGGTVVLTYTATNASACSLGSSPALWTGANPASVDCTGTYEVTLPASTSLQQWTLVFTATDQRGQTATSTQTLTELAPTPPAVASQSPNWSGYVVPSSTLVTAVTGEWTVPVADCATTPNGSAAVWVGIGGLNWPTGGDSGTLLQTGTTIDCVNGSQQTRGWVEEYPSTPNTSEDFTGFPVSPGDAIKASVFQAGSGAWETRVDDLTTGLSGVMVTGQGWGVLADAGDGSFTLQGSTVGLSYSGGYTAEWIVEDFDQNGVQVPFADYGTVNFTNLTTSLSPWYLTPDETVAMVQNGVTLSTPTPPNNGGFSVTYTG